MCGIVGAFDLKQPSATLRPQVLEMAKRIRHRGPDWSGIYSAERAIWRMNAYDQVDPKSEANLCSARMDKLC